MKASKNTSPQFIAPAGSPYQSEHALVSSYLEEPKASTLPADSVKFEKPRQLALLCAAMEQMECLKQQRRQSEELTELTELIRKLAGRKLPYTEAALIWNVSCAANILTPKDPQNPREDDLYSPIPGVVPTLLDQVELLAQDKPLAEELLQPLQRLHDALQSVEFWGANKKMVQRLEALLAQKSAGTPDTGEAWADAIQADINRMPAAMGKNWQNLLKNAPKGTNAKPTAKWKKTADTLLAAVGPEEFAGRVEHWFALVGVKATDRIQLRNAELLRALVWYASLLTGETVCRALANAVEGGLRKLPNGSLYASSISKACIAALESMPGLEPVAQLSRLKHRVKSPWGLEEIEKAFNQAVERSGISRAEIEELSVPTFGLDQQGSICRQVGEFTSVLSIVGTREVALQWLDASGHELPKKPKLSKTQSDEEKDLKQLARDIEKMLGAQRCRLENFLERERTWPFEVWKVRYLEHPLMAPLSQRLIWHFSQGKKTESGIWNQGQFVQENEKPIDWLGPTTKVQLWHPLEIEPARVLAWRQWLEGNEVTQPFKQAHREIYILTEAELGTQTYSNRFAAHILRQHQFKALCEQRGWKSDYVGSWDSSGMTPTRDLPGWGLHAEFWIGAAGEEYADSGVALHVATDQVRFLNAGGQAVPLAEVPALVFSEVMRDVDLFVSVCSVGNDPAWADGGPNRQGTYWREWAFGALNATAATRYDILERLVPKLKIAGQCSLTERFLVVRGQLRTYKIHLGSGNILMEPNDQYLCIVPDRSQDSALSHQKVFLPFEGDNTLSVILSKAFLLAEDNKIKDQSILSQIKI